LNKIRLLLVSILLLASIALSGCIDADFHLTVNKDGSGDFDYKMLMDSKLLALATAFGEEGSSSDPIGEMLTDAQASGFATTNINENGMVGFEAKKHIDNLQESLKEGKLFGQENMDSNIKPGEGLIIEKGFLKTAYRFNMDFDMSDMANSSAGQSAQEDAMTQSMLRSMNFNFALTLPVAALTHNASKIEDEGKTLVWTLVPGQKNPIAMTAEVWNMTNIALLGGGALIILALIIAMIMRKRKQSDYPI